MADRRVNIRHHGLQPLQHHQQSLVCTWSLHATGDWHHPQVHLGQNCGWVICYINKLDIRRGKWNEGNNWKSKSYFDPWILWIIWTAVIVLTRRKQFYHCKEIVFMKAFQDGCIKNFYQKEWESLKYVTEIQEDSLCNKERCRCPK